MNEKDRLSSFFDTNRTNWNERVGIHLTDESGIYRIEAFKKGEDSLGPIEGEEIGDVTGKKLLHLQCHFGLDSISLARRGATVTALDFSPAAIEAGRNLANEVGSDVRFVEANVYDAPTAVGGDFDIVFSSWGAIGWLPDIKRWARIVAEVLRPGGFVYLAEGHPTLFLVEDEDGKLVVTYDWQTPPDQPILEVYDSTYAGDGRKVENDRTYGWNHSFSSIFDALAAAGLSLRMFREHDMIPWRAFPSMERRGSMFVQSTEQKKIPISFSLKAEKA